jgi:type IV pilus assembly protein PilY1
MTKVIMVITLLWSTSQPPYVFADPLALPDVPLVVLTTASPNIMLLIDTSGSMNNVVPDTPYDENTIYPTSTIYSNCVNFINPASGSIDLLVRNGEAPYFRQGSTTYSWGTGTGSGTRGPKRCFRRDQEYDARLYADSGSTPAQPGNYLDAVYTGNYLNWYFGVSPWTNGARLKPGVERRMTIAQTAAKQLVDSLSNMRMGLASYNGAAGATMNIGVKDLNTTQKTALQDAIDDLEPSGSTPLAESLQDIGRYFVQGYNNTLTLHPDDPERRTTKSAYTAFDHQPNYASGVTQQSPMQYFCQKNFAVLLTDGRPQSDRNISSASGLQDYDGDCASGCLSYDRKVGQEYESEGSDYLDDVALALYDMDLRPDLDNFEGEEVKNNIITHTIGFADAQVINDPLMQDTAANGGGLFLTAKNAAELVVAFKTAVISIESTNSSTASVALNSGSHHTDSHVYQARFNSGDWSGELLSFPIDEAGQIGTANWNAGVVLKSLDDDTGREILTFNPDTGAGISFRWDQLSTTQQTLLHTNASGINDGQGEARLQYLRGSDDDEGSTPPKKNYRVRPNRLGDLANSDPFYVGAPIYPDTLGADYPAFRSAYKGRPTMIYVGGNDGMLHAFDASDGSEELAYIPHKVFANLSALTSPSYSHRYYVDGSPTVGDVYGDFGSRCPSGSACWRSILVSGLRKGGQGLFALDVTDPATFDESNAAKLVLWEFTDANDADLGYSFSQPSLVKLANGRWAAVFGNGYNNAGTGHAVLYMVFLDGFADGTWTAGTDFIKLDTGVGNTTTPNGLATPAAVDLEGDFTVDLIYAGDLQGNLWRFDLRDTNPSNWEAPVRLFTGTASQPITSRPQVGFHPHGAPETEGVLIYFGTGKYLESSDPTTTATQTFYGLWDKLEPNPTLIARSELREQTVLAESSETRVTSNHSVDWDTHRGWYLDLPTTGERQVSNAILRNQRIIFTTLIPDARICSYGGDSWLMELNAFDGNRLETPPFDLNDDGKFDDHDLVNITVDGQTEKVAVSGVKSTEGILPSPTVLFSGDTEFKYNSGSAGGIFTTTEDPGPGASGRQAWRQLQ